jgi:aspartate-semialdehyde dehydrogenase
MSHSVEVALLGATGATGEQVLSALEPLEFIARVIPLGSATRSPRVDTVSFRGQNLGVEPAPALGNLKPDLAILCVPPNISARVAPELARRGVLTLDLGNVTNTDYPLVLPGVSPELPEAVAKAGALRTPSSIGAMLAALVAPLVPAGLTGCRAVVHVGASVRGRAGMEELGQQVVAALNNQDPHRRVFVDGLAFDLLAEDVAMDEWSRAELQAASEIAALTGLGESRVAVQVGTAPMFAGITAAVHLTGVGIEAVEELLGAAPGIGSVSRAARLRPRAVLGKPGVAWGRLRVDPAGDGVHLWAVTDDLATAGATAARIATWLNSAGLLGVQ